MRLFSCVLTYLSMVLVLALPITSQAVDSKENAASDTSTPVETGSGSQKSVDEIAREMTNPLAVFTYLDWNIEYRTYQGSLPGTGDQSSWAHIFRPVIPFAQKNGKGFVFSFALPYIDDQPIYWVDRGYAEWRIRQQDPQLQGDGFWDPTHGHTDAVSTDLVYGGVSDNGLILMYGLAGVWPTTSDTSNGRQQLILGPELNIGKMTDWGVYGALMSHVIDVAEKRDKGTPDTTQTTIQAYFSYGLRNGWQLISNPTITYDWEGDSGNKLNLPLGAGIAKTTKIGKMPLRVSAEIQKYVASTDRFATDWLFKMTISPVLPNRYTGD
jgi:hypothetical protein